MDKPVVLVVDDEMDARNAIIDFLEVLYDCKYRGVKDGEEAVHFVKSGPCDVIILDMKMPKKSGIAVIKEAKEVNPKVDILVVSAYVSDDVCEEAMRLGATDYAVKPVDLKAISLKFSNILEKRGQKVNKI
ncbi:MAG: response regulator [Candidatus Omnitrophica bacterium]|nr:response regulator [Candidatus Omnitrophota bacterium]